MASGTVAETTFVAGPNRSFAAPLTLMVALYFGIGFITALNDILVPHFKNIFHLSNGAALLVQSCFRRVLHHVRALRLPGRAASATRPASSPHWRLSAAACCSFNPLPTPSTTRCFCSHCLWCAAASCCPGLHAS